ncbi:hypothetical protein Tco_1509899 [Tanacetum coccineum]
MNQFCEMKGILRQFSKQLILLVMSKNHLGKFDGKVDEGFFVGYSLNSKAFKVFNSRKRIVEENLHIRFSENTSNVAGSGPDWLFDIDALTRTMNYELMVTGIQSNGFIGTKASDNTGQARKETEPVKDYILQPLWTIRCESNDQEKEDNVNNTNNVNAASTNKVNVIGAKTRIELPFDPNMPALEDYSIFDFIRDDEDDGVVADMNNLDTDDLIKLCEISYVDLILVEGLSDEEVMMIIVRGCYEIIMGIGGGKKEWRWEKERVFRPITSRCLKILLRYSWSSSVNDGWWFVPLLFFSLLSLKSVFFALRVFKQGGFLFM